MSAPTLPAQRQVVPCETCGEARRGLLADCLNALCVAAAIDYIAREDLRSEARDDI